MKTWVSLVTAMLLLITGLVATAPAEVVGRITQVEGRVDLLKGGQLPATPVKLEDPVALGDVLRTKSLSKANITFIDNTVITISPESRIAIEEYMFDEAKGKRSAVLQLFHGMALAVVSKIFKTEQPDFVIKTHTAIMGVRGTEVGIRLSANDSTFLNFEGLTRVASVFPEISGDLIRKAAKVALSFGKGYVDLGNMQATTVARGLTPTVPYGITDSDKEIFRRQMVVSTLGSQGGHGKASPAVCSPTASTCTTNSVASGSSSETASNAANTAFGSGTNGMPGGGVIVVQPVSVPVPVSTVATIVNLTFSPSFDAVSVSISGINNKIDPVTNPLPSATFAILPTGPTISGQFNFTSGSSSVSNNFTMSSFSFTAGVNTQFGIWISQNPLSGTLSTTNTIDPITGKLVSIPSNLSGPVNGPLSGTMNLTLNTFLKDSTTIDKTFTLQGAATYTNGNLTLSNLTGTFDTNGSLFTGIVPTGTGTQLAALTAARAGTAVRNANLGLLAGTRMGTQRVTLLRR